MRMPDLAKSTVCSRSTDVSCGRTSPTSAPTPIDSRHEDDNAAAPPWPGAGALSGPSRPSANGPRHVRLGGGSGTVITVVRRASRVDAADAVAAADRDRC